MSTTQATRIVRAAQRNINQLFDEIVAELTEAQPTHESKPSEQPDEPPASTDPTVPPAGASPSSGPWSLDESLPAGGWEEVGRAGRESYKWPDGNVDLYEDFVRYRGTGEFAGLNLALGYNPNGDIVGFILGSRGGSKRGLTYFFPADDFAATNEKVSMIRGGGPRGRSGFGPADALPSAYGDFNVAMLSQRKEGKWNVQAVVADAEDHETMLTHTALQAKLRGLA